MTKIKKVRPIWIGLFVEGTISNLCDDLAE